MNEMVQKTRSKLLKSRAGKGDYFEIATVKVQINWIGRSGNIPLQWNDRLLMNTLICTTLHNMKITNLVYI